jgi:signal transduction histidine kinase
MTGSRLAELLDFYGWSEVDRQALARLGPLIESNADHLVEAFYQHLCSFPATERLLQDPASVGRLRAEQRRYLLSLAGPEVDGAYVDDRRRIGAMHERIGLEPRWYIGAYALYLSLLTPKVLTALGEGAGVALCALQKLLLFDTQIAMEHYIAERERDLQSMNDELVRSGRRLAQDLEARGVELDRVTDRARAAERLASVGALVAGLAHEIGTPMGVIQGHAKLLEPHVDGEDARWRLRTIREQIGRISRILQSLLHMARPAPSRQLPVQLGPLLENTAAFLREKLALHEIVPQLALDETLPPVLGDPERLQQVFLNLFLNAADAMPDGGELRVDLSSSEAGDAEVTVCDTGAGIPTDARDRIFEPFYTTKEAGEGNGLGLAVAHGIITEHHGLLELAQTDDRGTTFRVLLPLA